MTDNELKNKLETALGQRDITLLLTDADDLHKSNMEVLHYLLEEKGFLGIHVTVNKPYQSIRQGLEKLGADLSNIFFIDAVSHELGVEKEDTDNVVFLESPHDLSNISIATSRVAKSLPERKKFLFFDSLSALTTYHSLEAVTEFSHQLIGKVRKWNAAGIMVSLEEEIDEELTAHLTEACDQVIRI